MTDLTTITPIEQTLEIVHPATGQLLGVRVALISLDDERTKRTKRTIADQRLKLEARGKNFKAVDIEDNQRTLLFACMTGWEWYEPEDGVPAPTFEGEVPNFNRKSVMAVFEKLPWFADQIDEALGETKSFFEESKAT